METGEFKNVEQYLFKGIHWIRQATGQAPKTYKEKNEINNKL